MSTLKQTISRARWILLAFLSILAALSLQTGIRGALNSSRDSQWWGANLLRQDIDPWKTALLGQSISTPHFSQPTSLHMFYVLLLPFSKMSFHHAAEAWCFINILLSVAVIYLLKNLFGLSRFVAVAMLFLLWISAPFRATLQSGTLSIFELVLFCIVFYSANSTIRGIALGFSLSDYIFAPVVLSFLWFKHNIRTLTIAVIVVVLAVALAWSMVGGSVSQIAFEPFSVAGLTPRSGTADMVTLLRLTLARCLPSFGSSQAAACAAGLIASGAYGLFVSRRRLSNRAYLTLISVASLFMTRHSAHDYIFLLVPLVYAFSESGKSVRSVVAPIVAVFWFMDGLFPPLAAGIAPTTGQLMTAASACCLLATLLFYITWSMLRTERQPHVERSEKDRRRNLSPESFSVGATASGR